MSKHVTCLSDDVSRRVLSGGSEWEVVIRDFLYVLYQHSPGGIPEAPENFTQYLRPPEGLKTCLPSHYRSEVRDCNHYIANAWV